MSATLTNRPPAVPATVAPAAVPVAAENLLGGRYLVDCTQPLRGAGGGLAAFNAVDRVTARDGLMAVQVRPDAPPRSGALASQLDIGAGLLVPLMHGAAAGPGGQPAWFVICPAPAGPALWPDEQAAIQPWTEGELFQFLIRPVATVLEQLRLRGRTHRAVRPNNLFRAVGGPVELGCAWASPPAMLQPPAFEPPYVAMCLPAGRGDGTIADDIYALGVTVLALSLGRLPWAELSDEELIRRKLEVGSYTALVGDARPPPGVADLVRAMLAEEPEYRPSPALLSDPAAARARRIATRPERRASRPLQVGDENAWDARTLAYLIARDPAAGAKLLRLGVVDHWLRRVLEDVMLAARMEEPARQRSGDESGAEAPGTETAYVMRAIAALDPLAPLCWDGLALWPDGLGPALVAAGEGAPGGIAQRLCGLVAAEAVLVWTTMRSVKAVGPVIQMAREQRALLQRRDWAGGLARLRYELNPLLPCRSPALGGRLTVRLSELLPALEAAMPGRPRGSLPLDRETTAFIAARQQARMEMEISALTDTLPPERMLTTQIHLLARQQTLMRVAPLPQLAGAFAEAAKPALSVWHSRTRRAAKEQSLKEAAGSGDLARLLSVLEDPAGHITDGREMGQATAVVQAIDAELAAIAGGEQQRNQGARVLGRDIAAALGLAVLAVAIVAALLQ
jgi:hypothetical protein